MWDITSVILLCGLALAALIVGASLLIDRAKQL
jgi:hypothetical protein